jgi:alcohol dehydrogenase
LAGLAFDQSGLGIIHSLAGPLAAQHHLHHGRCTALLLPHGLAYNLPTLGEKRAPLLQALGMPVSASDDEVVENVKAWIAGLGLPTSLHEAGITTPDLSTLAEEASRMALLPNNPRPATADDCRRVFERAV